MDPSRTSQGAMVRARIVVSGRVQGVYFRASARHAAGVRGLSGWVRNRVDGTVEAVVEGEEEAVQGFITWCHAGPPNAYVADVQVTAEPYTAELHGFRVV